jgi:glucokinase
VAAAAEAEAALVGSDLLFVSVGTGIAAVSVRDGIAERGASGRAGEIGHIPVVPYGVDCGCGGRGCAEAYASAASIGRRWRAVSGYPSGDAEQVVALLRSDPRAATVWSTAVNALAAAIVAAVCVLDPPLIALGGGLSRAGDALLVPLRTALWFSWRPEPPIHLSRLGVDAGVLGAARLAQRAAHELVKEST